MIARPVRTLPSLAALVLAALLAACGAAAPTPDVTTGPASPQPVVTVAPTAVPSTEPSSSAEPTAAPTEAALFPVTLTDDEGGTAEIPAEPAQIVTLTPAATEILFELGVGDRIVGKVEDFSPYPEAAAAIPDVAKFGSVDVEPNTSLAIVTARPTEHRLALRSGEITARIVAPPRLFFVETASGTAIDLGCEYTLRCDRAGAGILRVQTGWVAFEFEGRESLVPAGAICRTRPGSGPGTPHFEDAPPLLGVRIRGSASWHERYGGQAPTHEVPFRW